MWVFFLRTSVTFCFTSDKLEHPSGCIIWLKVCTHHGEDDSDAPHKQGTLLERKEGEKGGGGRDLRPEMFTTNLFFSSWDYRG